MRLWKQARRVRHGWTEKDHAEMDDRNQSSLGGPRALHGAALTCIPVTQWRAHSQTHTACVSPLCPMVYPDIGKETASTQRAVFGRFQRRSMVAGRYARTATGRWVLNTPYPTKECKYDLPTLNLTPRTCKLSEIRRPEVTSGADSRPQPSVAATTHHRRSVSKKGRSWLSPVH